ncbi:MAG: metallophosphoesterase [Oscillospiraceae bacterium]|nr:metallophosphoesterase [Oscillospiraceae bacterium]
MNVAVFSDTHGNTGRMLAAVRAQRPDVLIHLGDYDRDAEDLRQEFPEIPLYVVCGNCDYGSQEPVSDVLELGPVRAFITHGHAFNVRWGVDALVYAAQEEECQLALYGHTHVADVQEVGGVKVVDPGTAGVGRDTSYAWIRIFDNGGIAVEIRDL